MEFSIPWIRVCVHFETQSMERMFLFAAMWAFGGALSSDSKCDNRRRFSQEWRKLLPSKTVKLPEQVGGAALAPIRFPVH